jgi:hypothetical protein
VGPRGRVVATLEPRAGAVPRAAELAQAALAEGGSSTMQDEGEGWAAARYALGPGRDGFLAVRRTPTRTIWCASTAQARPDDVDDALALCRNLASEP